MGLGPCQELERLAQYQRERHRQQRIQHPRPCFGGIFPEGEDRSELAIARRPNLEATPAADDSVRVERSAKVTADDGNAQRTAGNQKAQGLGDLAERNAVPVIDAQTPNAEAIEAGCKNLPDLFQIMTEPSACLRGALTPARELASRRRSE